MGSAVCRAGSAGAASVFPGAAIIRTCGALSLTTGASSEGMETAAGATAVDSERVELAAVVAIGAEVTAAVCSDSLGTFATAMSVSEVERGIANSAEFAGDGAVDLTGAVKLVRAG